MNHRQSACGDKVGHKRNEQLRKDTTREEYALKELTAKYSLLST